MLNADIIVRADRGGARYSLKYTKHYYAGSQRISSKLGLGADVGSFNCNWLIVPFGSGPAPINEQTIANEKLDKALKLNSKIWIENNFALPYQQNAGYTENCVPSYAGNQEQDVYWYHPDYLGSSSFITGLDGEVTQSIDYFPSGEVFVENHKNSYNTPYKFNGKEQDSETGYYYYGARYYNPRVSLWLNVDPLAELAPDQSPYIYASNNPINRIDPDGRWDIEVHAYRNRSRSGYAVLVVRDNDGREVYRTVVKTIGTGGRIRNVGNSDTPQGKYKILGWRKTGSGTGYNRVSFGPNDLLALDYQGKEGGSRDGMHVHGGRQEGKYKGRTNLASTHGCMRINDDDIKDIKRITTGLEKNDPTEKRGYLNLIDDLKSPVSYGDDRHSAGKSTMGTIIDAAGDGYTNMRPNPGSGDPTRVDAGSSVEILDSGSNYTKIRYDGSTGYIPNRYVKKN